MDENKLSNTKIALLIFLFVVMFSFAYFLLYSPIRISDDNLLIISMIFTTLVVAIPLYIFIENRSEEKTTKTNHRNKKTKKRAKKSR